MGGAGKGKVFNGDLFGNIASMPSAIDIYRTAKLLTDQHHENAILEASMKADTMLEKGDLDGQTVWMAVVRAIKELQSDQPTGLVH
jgi:hypothetical protein